MRYKEILEKSKNLSMLDKRQISIAKKTLSMPDAMGGVMGGPSKREAREILIKFGYSDKEIKKLEKGK